jgi:hypothetical protein
MKLLWGALLLLAPCSGSARELYGPEAGVVPYGMGRAYSAIADDWLALHYNPAGLAVVKGVDVQFFDFKAGSNADVVKSYGNISNLGKSGNLADTLNDYVGKHIKGELSNHSQLTIPHGALGISYDVNANIDLQNKAYPYTWMRYTKDLSFSLGTAVGIGKRNEFRIGFRGELIRRQGSIRQFTIPEIVGSRSAIIDSFSTKGTGYSATVGMQYQLPSPGRTEITTSFVWHDIGHTSFGDPMNANRPTRIEQNIVAGVGMRIPIGGRKSRRLERRFGPSRSSSHLTFAFDYSHMNYGLSQEHLPKHIHFGMNLDLPLLSFQLGLNQTSLTGGVGVDIGVVRVAAATYGEELGSFGGQRTDRRYIVSVGSSFGFKGL